MKGTAYEAVKIVFYLLCVSTAVAVAVILEPKELTTQEDGCLWNESICSTSPRPVPVTVCSETQFYSLKGKRCLSLEGRDCQEDSDCVEHSYCSSKLNTTLGIFTRRCACLDNYFRNKDGFCKASSKYGEFCDSLTQPCESGSPLMICSKNTCSCSDKAYVYDQFKATCSLRIGEYCYEYRSIHHSVCITNALCPRNFPPKKTPIRCTCAPGYVFRNSSDGNELCLASFGQACNETSICDNGTGLVCTDGKCLCDSPLSQIFDTGRCRSVVGTHCNENSSCVSNAFCNDLASQCECKEGYSSTLKESRTCKLGYKRACGPTLPGHSLCNHDRGLVCKNKECLCYDSSLVYRNVTGICSNSVGKICGSVSVRGSHLGKLGRKLEYQHQVTFGCNRDLLCGKIKGHDTCSCLDVEAIDSDRTFKIEYCLPSYYY